jgi:tape measure domain-containing protein
VAVELATGYVSIVPSTRGIAGQLRKELGGPLEQVAAGAGITAGRSFGDNIVSNTVSSLDKVGGKITSGLGTALKIGGATAAAGFGASLIAGFGRLRAIDDARFKLQGLGHDTKTVDAIMQSALDSVKGTAFGLGDAATIAAGAVAAGVPPGKELTRTLSLTGDAASIAGVSLGEMGSIFGKVAAGNRMMTQEMNQLTDRGIPILQWLQDEFGVTAEAAREMVSNGEVDFATFQRIIEKNIGGAALTAGESFSGSLSNMGAAIGRFGAALLGPAFAGAPTVFEGIIGAVDRLTERVGPFAETVGTKVGGAITRFVDGLRGIRGEIDPITGEVLSTGNSFNEWGLKIRSAIDTVSEAIQKAVDWYDRNRDSIQNLVSAIIPAIGTVAAMAVSVHLVSNAFRILRTATPLGMLLALVTGLIYAYQNSETFRNAVDSVVEAFRNIPGPVLQAIAVVAGVVVGVIAVVKVFGMLKTAFAVVKGAFLALKLMMMANPFVLIIAAVVALVIVIVKNWDTIKAALGKAWNWIKRTAATVWNGIRNAITTVVTAIRTRVTAIFTAIRVFISSVFNAIRTRISSVMTTIRTTMSNVWNAIRNAVTNVVNTIRTRVTQSFNNIRTAITNIVNGIRTRISEVFTSIRTRITDIVNGIRDRVTNVFNAIRERMSNAATRARELVSNAFSRMRDAVRNTIDRLLGIVRGIPGRIVRGLGNLGKLLFDSGKKIIQGLIDGVKNMAGAVKDAVSGVLKKARDLLPFSPAKEGPFAGRGWTLYAGRSLIDGLAQGIRRQEKPLVRAVSGVMASAQDAMRPDRLLPAVDVQSAFHADRGGFDITAKSAREELDQLRRIARAQEDTIAMLTLQTRRLEQATRQLVAG